MIFFYIRLSIDIELDILLTYMVDTMVSSGCTLPAEMGCKTTADW